MTQNDIRTFLIAMTLFVVAGALVVVGTVAHAPAANATTPAATATENLPSATENSTSTAKRSLFANRNTGSQPSLISGPFGRFYAWLITMQQQLHRSLATAVKDLKSANPLWAALVLGAISFAYGVLHAAGPGHGKAVISSYVLANERTVKRGIALSFLAAAIQGMSALVIVAILVLVMNATSLDIKATEGWIETLSWGFVTLIGIWLLYSQLKILIAGWRTRAVTETDAARVASHADDHQRIDQDTGQGTDLYVRRTVKSSHAADNQPSPAHYHHHEHSDSCGCGHAHIPSPDQLTGAWSWPKALAVAFSVGIRPCTGAIIVLVFAISQGLMWAGVFATFAMALGTAITVSALAALAVGGRELATRMAGEGSRWGWRIERAAGLGGALLVTALGVVFFMGSLQPASPF